MILSGCVTTTYRDGKAIETSKDSSSGRFNNAKMPTPPPAGLGTDVRVSLVPRKDNPQFYEYRVAEVYPKTIYSRAGIKSGDTLLSIDGRPIQTMEDAVNIPNRISALDFNKLLVRRNGKNIILQAKN
ncbi:hypothetical protein AZI86_13235 [Bdellovibrio bacteriovorus]|uniref:PDZ domain-containing protein n=2 Tax=Bdellovibrio bacteriovorus TaxID=959 RepID=A0A150WJS5_BDEBC|nr:hypothetical protein AZI86_13235 [Bdellovibrio bacteriovorus]